MGLGSAPGPRIVPVLCVSALQGQQQRPRCPWWNCVGKKQCLGRPGPVIVQLGVSEERAGLKARAQCRILAPENVLVTSEASARRSARVVRGIGDDMENALQPRRSF